ncbi:MAG: hypothetical protein AAFY77_08030 [Pseudomonadota bacterium]
MALGNSDAGGAIPGPEVGSAGGVVPVSRDAMGSGFDVSAGYRPVGIGVLNDP